MAAGRSASLCWSLLSACILLVSADTNITAEHGETVTLPCRAPNKETVCVVEWGRSDLWPEYVLFYRPAGIDPDNQHPSFVKRVDLQDRQMKDGDLSVVIQNVTIDDTGRYECRAVKCRRAQRLQIPNVHSDPDSVVYLRVAPPGNPRPSVGLAARLTVSAVLLVVAIVAAF